MIMVRAYKELSTCRSFGWGLGPIPWLAMLEWCRYHQLKPHVTDHLIHVLQLVDAETLRRERERAKSK
jgi:hypothetical protein